MWVKLDDGFADHAKIDPLSHGAFRLHVAGLLWCGRTGSDGRITRDRPGRIMPGFKTAFVDELVDAGIWHQNEHHCERCEQPGDDAYIVHDFLDYNPTAAKVKAERQAAADRMKKRRAAARSPERSEERDGARTGVRSPSPTRPDPKGQGRVSEEPSARLSVLAAEGDADTPTRDDHLNLNGIRNARARLEEPHQENA
jgi:hypothetical protein